MSIYFISATDSLGGNKDIHFRKSEEFLSVLGKICQVLKSLKYDISEIQKLQIGSMDNGKFGLVRVKKWLYILNAAL